MKEYKPSELLPHKAPMLLVDEVITTDFEKTILVKTTIRKESMFFMGHFPDYPLLPGIVLIEMMFQASGILNRIITVTKSNHSDLKMKRIGKAVKIQSATFYKEVFPETSLLTRVEKIRSVFKFTEFKAVVTTEDQQKVCDAIITVTL